MVESTEIKILEHARDQIKNGQCLEIINEIGWEEFKKILIDTNYSEIVEGAIKQIQDLEQINKDTNTGPAPEWLTHNNNEEAKLRIKKVETELMAHFSQSDSTPCVVHSNAKKIMVSGNSIARNDRGESVETPVTRIYFSVATQRSPEAFKALIIGLEQQGILDTIEVAYNLENFEGDSINKIFENNTIILYVYGTKPNILEKISQTITEVKNDNPDPWKLSARSLIRSKENVAKDFMIPLDDTTAFVEMPSNESYHSTVRGHVFQELTGQFPWTKMNLSDFSKSLSVWKKDHPNSVAGFKNRLKHMPGILSK